MRRRFMLGLGSLGVSAALVFALGAGVAGAKPSAKPGAKGTKFSCTETSYSQSYPSTSGFGFGLLKCSKSFGEGVQYSTFSESIIGTQVKVSGTFKNFFDNGTVDGTYGLSGTLSSGPITTSGPLKITGGTGAYKHAKGSGKLTCTTNNGGKTYTCTATGAATA